MKCYKVVKVSQPLTSCIIRTTSSVVYEPGEWTTPRTGHGPLTAFFRLKEALAFLTIYKGFPVEWQIWRAVCEESEETEVWLIGRQGTERTDRRNLPTGTVLADRVRLIECVYAFRKR